MTQIERLTNILKKIKYFHRKYGLKVHLATQVSEYGLEQVVDALLANGVIAPPVFVGQMVYHYCPELGGIFPYFVENLNIGFMDKERNYWTYEANCHEEETDELLDEIDFDLDDIGKTVFLTREEAEKALAKMKGGE